MTDSSFASLNFLMETTRYRIQNQPQQNPELSMEVLVTQVAMPACSKRLRLAGRARCEIQSCMDDKVDVMFIRDLSDCAGAQHSWCYGPI